MTNDTTTTPTLTNATLSSPSVTNVALSTPTLSAVSGTSPTLSGVGFGVTWQEATFAWSVGLAWSAYSDSVTLV